ncbi:Glutamate racemase [Desulfurobacterium thermolithotrophum DSM 11699]|uniref:Glutamate racemase n=1 Tax=Desulfurobacterium thermolithotrophum (strain DSM 11699 / BSA) TaxID=868864 RepID=F0S0E5_DESTD|nr:glutamate racemase [Desulfurobacterium thermolithotrophum]ADY72673.1 Glutamate racemase [Desulfurobacterium thermolithotrophum DSM 11699]
MSERPIGIFDSGVGGLTVLRALRKKLPSEDLIYFGDTARVPYGTKSPKTIIRYSIENTKLLKRFNVKMVIVACNTSSSYALEILKSEFSDVPILGVINPGARLAVSATKSGKVGVIGTEATIKSGAYRKAIHFINPSCLVFEKVCPLFVPLIEEGWLNDPVTLEVARRYVLPLLGKGIDTLVLGCTHYPLIKDILLKICKNVTLIDSAQAIADEVAKALPSKKESGKGNVKILVSDKTDRFEKIAKMIMGNKIEIEEVSIDKE